MPASAHLAPLWLRVCARSGLNPDASSAEVSLWLETRRELSDLAAETLRRRIVGQPLAQITRELGLPHHARAQQLSENAGLRELAPHLPDVPGWTAVVLAGESVDDVPPWLVEVALHGWPAAATVSPDEQARATKLWLEGADLVGIAHTLDWPLSRLRSRLAAGSLTLSPERVSQADLGRRFGWSRDTAPRLRSVGLLPAPDSPPGPHTWWWESTVSDQIEPGLPHGCGDCAGRFGSARALAIHRAARH